MVRNAFNKERIVDIKDNDQLKNIINLLESSKQTKSISDEEQQIIEINKNKIDKLLAAQYTNRHNLDKIIITILFTEVGYLVHTIKKVTPSSIMAIIILCIGIFFAIEVYKRITKSFQYAEQLEEYRIYEILGLPLTVNINKLKYNMNKNRNKLDIYNEIVYYCVICGTLLSIESKHFENIKVSSCCQIIILISTVVAALIFSLVRYFRRECDD